MTDSGVVVIGAGGHGRVVVSILQAMGRNVIGILEDDQSLEGKSLLGAPIIGPIALADTFSGAEAIIAICDNESRSVLAERLNLKWTTAVHPSAVLSPATELGPGTIVCAGAIVQPGTTIGRHSIINTGASVDHDCCIGDFVHVAPGVHVGGNVEIANHTFIGIGSAVTPGVRIAEKATIGAGAVVTRNIETMSLSVGVPAICKRRRGQVSRHASERVPRIKPTTIVWDLIDPPNLLWADLLQRVPHDFYHLPAYVSLCGRFENATALAFHARCGAGECLIPLLSKTIPHSTNGWFDFVSPYGYCAPLFTTESPDDQSRLLKTFYAAMQDVGAVSVFLRMHPLMASPSAPLERLGAVIDHGETVWIDLARSEQEISKQIRDGHRYDIRRLQKLNFVPVLDDWALYDEFIRLYTATMNRRNASASYFFNSEYFQELKLALGSTLHLCCVLSPEGEVAAGGLFTATGNLMQYHLSGSSEAYQHLGPTKLMLDFMCRWGRQHGVASFHLGGGVGTSQDSLFQFKAGFSPLRAHFKTMRIISNELKFKMLVRPSIQNLDATAELHAQFFPSYRKAPPIETSGQTKTAVTSATNAQQVTHTMLACH